MLASSAPFELSHLEHGDVGVQLPQEPPHPECVVFSPSIVAHVHVEVHKAKLTRGKEGEKGEKGEKGEEGGRKGGSALRVPLPHSEAFSLSHDHECRTNDVIHKAMERVIWNLSHEL